MITRPTSPLPAVVVVVLVASTLLSSCTTSAPAAGGALVVQEGGATLHAGAAAWTVRATSSGREDVVAVPGLGEVIVHETGCRLVRALPDGGIAVWPSAVTPCIAARSDRLCFVDDARFVGPDGDVVTAHGCADKNELFLDRLAGGGVAGVGPRSFIERCAPVPSSQPSYLRVRAILVEDNDRPEHGLRLRYSDGFEVCFLARTVGRYRIEIDVEDPVRRRVTLAGAVDDL